MSTKIKINNEWIDVATNSVSDSIRNPDWSRKIQVSFAQLYAGYTCPEDGFFCATVANNSDALYLYINGQAVGVNNANQYSEVFVPVGAGDIIKSSVQGTQGFAYFIPYKISVAEPVYVGEKINGTKLTPTITTLTDTTTKIGEITLTKGKWLVYINSWTPIALESTEWALVIFGGWTVNVVPGLNAMIPLEGYVSVNSTTTYDLNLRTMLASPKTATHDYVFYAVRIG